ncbi:MAG: signal peptide peptidase SppA [Magnetococcales bacterium]|nr:signal peptide peptidase SppA [Magnetococcales bacterium]NGZ06065.1 signal peptide peptidase SppA [Magnetococcales bacterium]
MQQLEANRLRERAVLERLLLANLAEQKRARRAKNWFRVFIAGYLLLLVWLGHGGGEMPNLNQLSVHRKHVALVKLDGVILDQLPASAETVIKGLRDAFAHPDTEGVILRINSPGGSPVQAGQIYDELLRLQKHHAEIPVYAALEDLCASGGYYVAAAVPKIYADKATLVGSIGVMMQGFGVQQALEKLGVESRLLTAGKHKGFLDPFSPVNPAEKQHAQTLLNRIHDQFIKAVEAGRGDRLKASREELFQGLIWTGEDAVRLGLVDGLGSVSWIARQLIKNERIVDFTDKEDLLLRLSKGLTESITRGLALGDQGMGWSWR